MGKSQGRHRAERKTSGAPVAGAASIAAAAGAALVGMTPSLATSPQVMNTATVWSIRGTNIGDNPSDSDFKLFEQRMLTGAGVTAPAGYQQLDYPASFFPVSAGGFGDPTFDQSVAKGVTELDGKPQSGDVVFGFSQGAVVASKYKGLDDNQTPNVTYVLVENPNRPNGGILERFNGVSIPILGITANGATPNTGAKTVDISRQYDGWSDFPTYPLNPLATANAIAGIYYLHGKTQTDVTPEELAAAKASGNPIYYQKDTASNTEYYLIPTDQLPLLMPLNGIVPKPILDAADPPLRVLVELGYDRGNYATPTPAGIAPVVNPVTVATNLVSATKQGVEKGVSESAGSAPSTTNAPVQLSQKVTPQTKAPNDVAESPEPTTPPKTQPSKLNLPALKLPSFTGEPKPTKAQPKVKAPSVNDVTKAATNAIKKLTGGAKDNGAKDNEPKKGESAGKE